MSSTGGTLKWAKVSISKCDLHPCMDGRGGGNEANTEHSCSRAEPVFSTHSEFQPRGVMHVATHIRVGGKNSIITGFNWHYSISTIDLHGLIRKAPSSHRWLMMCCGHRLAFSLSDTSLLQRWSVSSCLGVVGTIRMKGTRLSHQRPAAALKDQYIILSDNKPRQPFAGQQIYYARVRRGTVICDKHYGYISTHLNPEHLISCVYIGPDERHLLSQPRSVICRSGLIWYWVCVAQYQINTFLFSTAGLAHVKDHHGYRQAMNGHWSYLYRNQWWKIIQGLFSSFPLQSRPWGSILP